MAGGLILGRNLQFAPNGDIVPFDPGVRSGTKAGTATNSSGGDGFDLAETSQITSDVTRRTGTLNFTYDLTDDLRFFAEGLTYSAESLELVDQSTYNVNLFGGLSAPIGFNAQYPLLSAQNRSALEAAGITTFQLSRASRDLVENKARAETDLYRVVIGLDGSFELGGRFYNWEVSGNQGRSESTFFQTVLNQQAFINSLNVAVVNGQVVCSTTPTPGLVIPGGGTPRADPNCVPLNLFGEGAPSVAARNYESDEVLTNASLEQSVFNAKLGGELFDRWGGPAVFNVGFERRIERGSSECRGQLSLAYERDRWGVNWQADYAGAAAINVTNTAETQDILGAGAYWLHNAGANLKISDQGMLRLSATNVFNEAPPIPHPIQPRRGHPPTEPIDLSHPIQAQSTRPPPPTGMPWNP